jgi:acetyl-CoA carboxylase carboxyl transferase subunit beta
MPWPTKNPPQPQGKKTLGKGVFRKCNGCGETHPAQSLIDRFEVCPSCGYHHRLGIDEWRRLLLDDAALELWDDHLRPTDPLGFSDGKHYQDRIASAQKATDAVEAAETGRAVLEGHSIAYGAYNFAFMGGSMGSVVGEKITRLFERATSSRLPVILLHASGGARMQEGILSLMQMAKMVAALERHRTARLPFISVLRDPTTGGVAASCALLGDVNVAEPGALIGFAGPRVIASTIGEKLPEGFQRSEFLLAHGMVDLIVARPEMKATLARFLAHFAAGKSVSSANGVSNRCEPRQGL